MQYRLRITRQQPHRVDFSSRQQATSRRCYRTNQSSSNRSFLISQESISKQLVGTSVRSQGKAKESKVLTSTIILTRRRKGSGLKKQEAALRNRSGLTIKGIKRQPGKLQSNSRKSQTLLVLKWEWTHSSSSIPQTSKAINLSRPLVSMKQEVQKLFTPVALCQAWPT